MILLISIKTAFKYILANDLLDHFYFHVFRRDSFVQNTVMIFHQLKKKKTKLLIVYYFSYTTSICVETINDIEKIRDQQYCSDKMLKFNLEKTFLHVVIFRNFF